MEWALGCMERVWAMEWAMESHSKDYWSFWATWLHGEGLGNGIPYQEEGNATTNPMFSFVSGRTGPGNRVRGSGSKPLKLAAV